MKIILREVAPSEARLQVGLVPLFGFACSSLVTRYRLSMIREYTDADLDALLAMHRAQGFDYPFPDLRDPIFVSKLVLCEDDSRAGGSEAAGEILGAPGEGKVVMAALARLTCEMYLLADPRAGTPHQRYAQLLELHRAGAADLRTRGLDDAHAWLPPPIAKRFGRRLENLGWIRDDAWTPYCRGLR